MKKTSHVSFHISSYNFYPSQISIIFLMQCRSASKNGSTSLERSKINHKLFPTHDLLKRSDFQHFFSRETNNEYSPLGALGAKAIEAAIMAKRVTIWKDFMVEIRVFRTGV